LVSIIPLDVYIPLSLAGTPRIFKYTPKHYFSCLEIIAYFSKLL